MVVPCHSHTWNIHVWSWDGIWYVVTMVTTIERTIGLINYTIVFFPTPNDVYNYTGPIGLL